VLREGDDARREARGCVGRQRARGDLHTSAARVHTLFTARRQLGDAAVQRVLLSVERPALPSMLKIRASIKDAGRGLVLALALLNLRVGTAAVGGAARVSAV